MNEGGPSEFEKARAKKLAQELAEKMSQYFPKPPEDARITELQALQETIEKMGFKVSWNINVDITSQECNAEITLLLPTSVMQGSNRPPD